MEFIQFFLSAVVWVVIIDAISSWFVRPDQLPRRITGQLTEPLYGQIRRFLDPASMGGLDLSPLILVISIQVVQSVLGRLG